MREIYTNPFVITDAIAFHLDFFFIIAHYVLLSKNGSDTQKQVS